MLKEELLEILDNEKDIVPFLKKLNQEDKKSLAPVIKGLKTEFFATKEVKKRTYLTFEYIKSDKQRALLEMACFVCCNKFDFKKTFWSGANAAVSDEYLNKIIPWYTPKWYSDLINEEIPWQLSYEKLIELTEKGILKPSSELITNKLPQAISSWKWSDEKKRQVGSYHPEVLLKNKVTLERHIWHLFENESFINNFSNYNNIEDYNAKEDLWLHTLKNLIAAKKLDRKKVLVATIYTSTKGFNKTLSGWFFDLLITLNPTPDEVLALQSELFAALNSPHSKVINTVLKYFKSVADQKRFKFKVFIENASILLNSETKSVVNSTLMILEKIVKAHKTIKTAVCLKTAEALINVDEKIQLRAAKIIEKYGDKKKQELLDEVRLYSDNLFHSSKEVLKEYLNTYDLVEDYEEVIAEVNFLTEENRLPKYESLDELIFFVSQVIDNNEVFHIDLLLSYLPKLNVLLNAENVSKLEPIFKRAFDLSMNSEWNSQIGNLESEAAYYINDFAEILMKKYPVELESFKKTKNQKIQKLKQDRFFSSHYKENLKEIEQQPIPDYIYQIHHQLFIKSKSYISRNLSLELLSTPTHSPCWIDPSIFIDRVLLYEQHDEQSDLYDFQIAFGRLLLTEVPSDISVQIEAIADKTMKDILKYHFGLIELAEVSLDKPYLWIQSVLSRNIKSEITYFQEYLSNALVKEIGIYNWGCKLSDYYYTEYDYVKGKHVEKKMVRKHLKLENFDPQKKEPVSLISSIKGIFNTNKKPIKVESIYEYMFFKKQQYYTTIQHHDDLKFLLISPNNPSSFLSHVIHHNLKESTFSDETSKKNMGNLLKGLYQIWHRSDYTETTYLFLATGLLCSDKVSRELAAELWIKTNSEGNINNVLLGKILGKLESGEYAPLKRFTDLLTSNLFNVSKRHNEHLFTLLNAAIGKMSETPIRGVKKLLEIFLELRYSNGLKISGKTKERLFTWKETSSLSSLIAKILNESERN